MTDHTTTDPALPRSAFQPSYTPEQYAAALELLRKAPETPAAEVARQTGVSSGAALKAREELGLQRHAHTTDVKGVRVRMPKSKVDQVCAALVAEPKVTDTELGERFEVDTQSVRRIRKALGLRPALERGRRHLLNVIRRMAANGHRAKSIAEELGVSTKYVVAIAGQNGITLHNDVVRNMPVGGKMDKLLEQTVLDLESSVSAARSLGLKLDVIDKLTAADYAESIGKAMHYFADLRRRLLEISNG